MQKHKLLKVYLLLISVVILAFNNTLTTLLTFIFLNALLIIMTLITCERNTQRVIVILSYGLLIPIQICYTVYVAAGDIITDIQDIGVMLGLYLLLGASFYLETFFEIRNYHHYFFHDSKNMNTLYFSDLQRFVDVVREKKQLLSKTSGILTKDNIAQILSDIRRTDSFSYTNNGTLTEEYFSLLSETMSDHNLYIVLSDTGSLTSQVVSLFTEKDYNHASISFDKQLRTLVSYNGGERVNPPGMNAELLSYLAKKENARVYVYSLAVTEAQKRKMAQKIREINTDGSAYNLLGMFLKQSYKPNIMYCSQFVYTLLEYAGVNYFKKDRNNIKPTDLVELDYYKKLKFEYEIKF